MLGAIIGDLAGSAYEGRGRAVKTKDFVFWGERVRFTDDTVMTVAVADALLGGGGADRFIDALRAWGRRYPAAGYGSAFKRWLVENGRQPYQSWGNGSAMRVSPCGWWAGTLGEAEELARESAAVTHDHPEGIKGAQAVAAAIYLARTGESKERIRAYVADRYGYGLDRTLDQIRPGYGFEVSCQDSVPEAIIAFLESDGFEDAIRNAVSLGGDSDTQGAIAGSIAEAAYGIDPPTVREALDRLDPPILAVLEAWRRAGKPGGLPGEPAEGE